MTLTRPSRVESARARERLLDAARDELAERSWADISMASVARRAEVGRSRLYNEFGSREELEDALIARERATLIARARRSLNENRLEPVLALAALADVFLTAVAESPRLVALISQDIRWRGPTSDEEASLRAAVACLAELVREEWPSIRRLEAELTCELLVRLAVSHLRWPTDPDRISGARIAQVFAPHLEKFLGVAQERRTGAQPDDRPPVSEE